MSSLGDIIRRQAHAKALEEGESKALSMREVGRRAAEYHDGGLSINWGTIGRYVRGEVRPNSHTLGAIANVLATEDHSSASLLAEMQQASGLAAGVMGNKWEYPPEVYQLDTPQLLHVENAIRLFAAANNRAMAVALDEDDEGDAPTAGEE